MPRTPFSLILTKAQPLAPTITQFVFEREDQLPCPFKPGQFLSLHIAQSTDESRPALRHYTLSGPTKPHQKPACLEIICAYVEGGLASPLLFQSQPGDRFLASGPYGSFVLKEEDKPKRYIFIATGTGIAPYRAMKETLIRRLKTEPLEIILLLGARSPIDALYTEEFLALAKSHPRFQLIVTYSRQTPPSPRPFERAGRIQAQLEILNLSPLEDIVYLCGNPHMVDEVLSALKEKGFPSDRLRRERYAFGYRAPTI